MNSSTLLLLSSLLLASCGPYGADSSDAAPSPPSHGEKNAPVAQPAPSPRFAVPIQGLPTMGDRDALVTIVEVTDYQCPYCARAEETIHALRVKYGRDLRIAVLENPLPIHEHARDRALLALSADERGEFETVHHALFAQGAALDVPTASATDAAKATLERSMKLVASLGVHGTPTFFVNGRKICGAQPIATFEAIIDQELLHARALLASGVAPGAVYDRIVAEARDNPPPMEDPGALDAPSIVAEAKTIGGVDFLGAKDAPRTIVLFTDFECPYCAKLDARLRTFVTEHPDVRVVVRQRPLPMHPHARLAAKAALAAAAQGRLAEYAALLFANQGALERDALVGYATRIGLDSGRFVRDLDAPETEQRLVDDGAWADKLQVTGTPTSFVDGRRVIGAQAASTFADALAIEAR